MLLETIRTLPPGEIAPLRIPVHARENLKFLLMAKHVFWGGTLHPEDGNHAIYHHEVRQTLTELDLRLDLANSYDVLFTDPDVDLVFPLLNRGGFLNSEMLIPLLCNRLGIAYVGGSPIIRGLGDDKAQSKLMCQRAGVPTAPWACYRRGAPVEPDSCPPADRWVIKPNASSASWAVSDAYEWQSICEAVAAIHAEGHDAIVEPYLDGYDVQVAFITKGQPVMLPMLIYEREDTQRLWTYYEKRDLIPNTEKSTLKRFEDSEFAPQIADMAQRIAEQFHPFDYGRIEFRFDPEKGEVNFIEINLNCNLWSEKVVAKAAAAAGFSHGDLLETIIAESLRRNGLTAG